MDISDGSSDEDSDYGSVDAARDQDEEILEVEENKNERGLQKINPRRRRDVEDTWAALKAIDQISTLKPSSKLVIVLIVFLPSLVLLKMEIE